MDLKKKNSPITFSIFRHSNKTGNVSQNASTIFYNLSHLMTKQCYQKSQWAIHWTNIRLKKNNRINVKQFYFGQDFTKILQDVYKNRVNNNGKIFLIPAFLLRPPTALKLTYYHSPSPLFPRSRSNLAIVSMEPSINDVTHLGGRGGSAKR